MDNVIILALGNGESGYCDIGHVAKELAALHRAQHCIGDHALGGDFKLDAISQLLIIVIGLKQARENN